MDETSLFRVEAVQARRDRFRGYAVGLPGFNAWKWLYVAAGLLSAIGILVACIPVLSGVRIAVVAASKDDQWMVQLRNSHNHAWFSANAAEDMCGAVLDHRKGAEEALAVSHAAHLVARQGRDTVLRRLMDSSEARIASERVFRCLEALD